MEQSQARRSGQADELHLALEILRVVRDGGSSVVSRAGGLGALGAVTLGLVLNFARVWLDEGVDITDGERRILAALMTLSAISFAGCVTMIVHNMRPRSRSDGPDVLGRVAKDLELDGGSETTRAECKDLILGEIQTQERRTDDRVMALYRASEFFLVGILLAMLQALYLLLVL